MKRITCCILLVFFSVLMCAQGTTSRIAGVVTDTTGAVVSGANVTATNEGTKVSYAAKTGGTGSYVFDSLQIGTYTITVEAPGFKKVVSSGNILNIGAPLAVNVTLTVGASEETVEVRGGAETVQTETSGNFGTTIDTTAVTQLPIVGVRGRNPLDFVTLVPGVVAAGFQSTGGGTHVHGSRDRAWNYTLDGIDTNETSAGGSNFSPTRVNPDSITEFRVITGNATAEFGRNSGAQVAMVTKSGTNQFHGTGFWFYQTPSITANTAANKAAVPQIHRGQFVQNIFGGSVGGPIIKNKTFFFFNGQWLRALNTSTVTRTVYTDTLKKTGVFRYATSGQNRPYGVSGASVDINGNPVVAFASYNIAANDPKGAGLDPMMQSFLALAPSPNTFTVGDGLNTAGYTFNTPQNERQMDLTFKIDHNFSPTNSIFIRYAGGHQNTLADTANSGQPRFPGGPAAVDTFRTPRNVAVNWRWTPSPTITNEVVVGMNRFWFEFITPLDKTDVSAPFVTNLVTDPLLTAAGNSRFLTTFQLVDNFTKVAGPHTLRGGINFRYGRHIDHRGGIGAINAFPQVTFSTTANPINDTAFALPTSSINSTDKTRLRSAINDLLGRIGEVQQGYVALDDNTFKPPRSFNQMDHRWPEYDFYIQDTWKVKPNLTVDVGLRLEARMAPRFRSYPGLVPNQPSGVDAPATTAMAFVPGDFYSDDWNNFGPSIGFAWDPWKDGKTSVRANYRLAYDRINTFSFSSSVFQGMPGLTYQLRDATQGTPTSTSPFVDGKRAKDWAIPVPTATPVALRAIPQYGSSASSSLTVADPSMRTPKVNMWGLSIQREIFKNTVFSITYNGRHGVGLYGANNANQVEIFSNGFLDAFKVVQAGGDSALFNQIFSADSRRGTATGSAFARTQYTDLFQQNAVAALALAASQRDQGGVPLLVLSGMSPSFFQRFPQFRGGLFVLNTNDYSTYHGLEAQIERRMTNGLLYQFSWTWAKSLDVRSFDPTFTLAATGSSQSAAATPWDIRNPRLNYAPSEFDRTHVFQGFFVYDLPVGKGKRFGSGWPGVVDRILGGWQIAGNGIWGSGRPITFFAGNNTFSSTVQTPASCFGNCDPYLGNVFRDATTNQQFYFNATGAWVTPTFTQAEKCRQFANDTRLCIPGPGEFSNIGRNYFRQSNYYGLNATVAKTFPIVEGHSLQFRWEIQNLLNNQVYDTFGSQSIQSGLFTRLNQATDGVAGIGARRMQLALKYNF